ncbi:30339_t:CDS:2 [Gigaspora margarita]|uniref:30339_t:CDS:1 n=1 Tax=Gigaspora margarita TaxID=4874 RepID=A0ABN7V2M1_GIGMA|nr:30339_t:CDS:2 [Gigaspora margarita]
MKEKRCVEDSTLLELLEEERVLDEFREKSKQVETEAKSQKNLDSTATQKNLKLDIGVLEDDEYDQIEELLMEYDELFAWTPHELERTNLINHSIQTSDAPPLR